MCLYPHSELPRNEEKHFWRASLCDVTEGTDASFFICLPLSFATQNSKDQKIVVF